MPPMAQESLMNIFALDLGMKSTEVQSSSMLASGAQVLVCGIYIC